MFFLSSAKSLSVLSMALAIPMNHVYSHRGQNNFLDGVGHADWLRKGPIKGCLNYLVHMADRIYTYIAF